MLKKGKLAVQSVKAIIPPDMSELHHLLSQALEKRGQHIQLTWRSSNKMVTYILDVICNIKGGDPQWNLYSENRGQRKLIVEYASYDVLLVHNLIIASSVGAQAASVNVNSAAAAAAAAAAVGPPPSKDYMEAIEAVHKEHGKGVVPSKTSEPPKPRFPNSGDISKLPISDLLEAIQGSKSTGKLEIRNKQNTAVVYVQDGVLVDATASDAEGDDAIIELLTWGEGQFDFEPRVLRNSHTVHQSLEELVAHSKQLQERMNYLKKAGMHFSSVFVPTNQSVTDVEFVQRAARGAPSAVDAMLQLYRGLNGEQTVESMIRSMPFSRIQLVNVIHHLMTHDLITLSTGKRKQTKTLAVQPRVIDAAAIQTVMMSLRRADTGMFIYPAFLYFLEQEYFRAYRARSPLSVIVFRMRVNIDGGWKNLPAPAVMDAVIRLSQLKRHVDLLGHYDAFDYAIMLPNTKANGAQIFANRVVRLLRSAPLAGEISGDNLQIACGSASIPEDSIELSSFLGAADLAMNQSLETKQPVIMFRDLKSSLTS